MRWLVLLLALASCRETTSMLVRISDDGLAIPADIASLRITVDNPDDPSAGLVYESAELPLCGSTATPGCHTLPLSVTLRPGAKSPDAGVRVVVTASSAAGTQVTSDAALFTFTSGQQLQLDFVLSPRCLATNCASLGRTCGSSGACEGLAPTIGAADLATPPAPTQPVARVLLDYALVGPDTLPPPQNLLPGDLVLYRVQDGRSLVDETGWTLVQLSPSQRLYLRRAGADESTAAARYNTTAVPGAVSGRIRIAYRNVDRYVLGYVGSYPFSYPSFDVPTGGALSISILPKSTAGCTITPSMPGSVISVGAGLIDEWGPLAKGQSGVLSIDCGQIFGADAVTAQVWLIPR